MPACSRSGAGAGRFLKRELAGITHLATGMRTDGFVNVLNRYWMTFKFTGCDGAAIKNESGDVEACQRHDSAGNCLVAADKNNQGVKKISASDKFDRVSDDFAADQGSAHP